MPNGKITELIFHDLFEETSFTRTFDSIWDERSMQRNDSKYEYCIPKEVEYGVAVIGIVDEKNETVPVSLTVDAWDEPNVTLGEAPELVHATITMDSLTPGTEYVLLKYTDCNHVPNSDFLDSSADRVIQFAATATSKTLADSFMSDTLAIYRCVKAAE